MTTQARLRVDNIPLHIRKEEFVGLFRPLSGCLDCRLVNESDRPVGYVTFGDAQAAAAAREAYHKWQGLGGGGLLVELLQESGASMQQYRAPQKRPPPELLDHGMQAGGYKQARRGPPVNLDYGEQQPRVDYGAPNIPPERSVPPQRGMPLDRYAAAEVAPGRGLPRYDDPAPAGYGGSGQPPPSAQYDDPYTMRGADSYASHPVPSRQLERAPPERAAYDRPPPERYMPEPQGPPVETGYGAGAPPGEPRPRYLPPEERGPPPRDYNGYGDGYGPPVERAPYRAPAAAYDDYPPHRAHPQGPPPASEPYGAPYGSAQPQYPPEQLGPEARPSLYVEQVPLNATKREISHIFRPFQGFKEVRMVERESKINPGEMLMFAFVDFTDTMSATEAMHALQGYPVDLDENPPINVLRIRYATDRHNAPRPGGPGGGFGGRGGGGRWYAGGGGSSGRGAAADVRGGGYRSAGGGGGFVEGRSSGGRGGGGGSGGTRGGGRTGQSGSRVDRGSREPRRSSGGGGGGRGGGAGGGSKGGTPR